MAENEDAEVTFLAWLVSHGAKVSNLEWPIYDSCGGRKAVARVDVPAFESYLVIPKELMITPTVALESDMGPKALEASLHGDALLATFLLWERHKKQLSFWYPYLRILPVQPSTICCWTEEELEALDDTQLVRRAKARREFVDEVYERLVKPFFEFEGTEFSWAWYLVQSRAFGRKLRETALVPFADCLNHEDGAAGYDMCGDQFRLYPTRAIEKGREALNSYGKGATNAKLLLDYGFALADNENDEISLCVSLDYKSGVDLKEKRILLDCNDIPHLAFLTLNLKDHLLERPSNFHALSLIRVNAAEDEEVVASLELDQEHFQNDHGALRCLAAKLKNEMTPFDECSYDDEKNVRFEYARLHRNTRRRILSRNYELVIGEIGDLSL